MVRLSLSAVLATSSFLSQIILAHPGHNVEEEIAEREAFFANSPRDLSHCTEILKKRGTEDKNRERIARAIAKARDDLGITKRRALKARATSPLSISHHSGLDVTPTTTGVEDIIFSNASCVLSTEGEVGPFWVSGEYIRTDLRETQPGIPIVIDGQFLDTTTCKPVTNLYWDVWNCNSTGVYGGVSASAQNGNAGDTSNINKTFLRGLQPTDSEGVAQFTTIFPGHYSGRTTHIHVVAHEGGSVLANGTYTGGKITHIGQLFFDQSLITQVYKTSPYTQSTTTLTTNAQDRVVATEIAAGSDPFFNYVLLGDTVSDGIFAWVTMGINQGASYTASAAAKLTSGGGVPVSGGGGGGPGKV
ncbi:extracellular dioxygenase protein [Rutstroemia sp. NJR-2017a BVV2]|nr:extracellular dioxygenase protein [Rutstroemia sp. NJR-2017a BVV2]